MTLAGRASLSSPNLLTGNTTCKGSRCCTTTSIRSPASCFELSALLRVARTAASHNQTSKYFGWRPTYALGHGAVVEGSFTKSAMLGRKVETRQSYLRVNHNAGGFGRQRGLRVSAASVSAVSVGEQTGQAAVVTDGNSIQSSVGSLDSTSLGNGLVENTSVEADAEFLSEGDGTNGGDSSKEFQDVVEVSVLEDEPTGRSQAEMARELESMGIEVPSHFTSGGNSSQSSNESSAEKLAAIMAKNGLDPSEFTEQYDQALARQLAEKQRKNEQRSKNKALLKQLMGSQSEQQEGPGLGNRASVAWQDAVQRSSRFTAERNLSWPAVIFWSTVLCGAVATAFWFRAFVWEKWEAQKLEREREDRIMRLNKLKHTGQLEEIEQASKKPPAVVSLKGVREQLLASQGVSDPGQIQGGGDGRELKVYGDDDDYALLVNEDVEELGWIDGVLQGLGLKKKEAAIPLATVAAAPVDPQSQQELRQEWERILEADREREAGRFYDVIKPDGTEHPATVGGTGNAVEQGTGFVAGERKSDGAEDEAGRFQGVKIDGGRSQGANLKGENSQGERLRGGKTQGVQSGWAQNGRGENGESVETSVERTRTGEGQSDGSDAGSLQTDGSDSKPFSKVPQFQKGQRIIEARIAGMTSSKNGVTSAKEKAAVIFELRTFAAEVNRAAPGNVNGPAFRAWWDRMTEEIARKSTAPGGSSAVEKGVAAAPPAENGVRKSGLKEGLREGLKKGLETERVDDVSSKRKAVLEEPHGSTGSVGDLDQEVGDPPSTSGRTSSETSESAASDRLPNGAFSEPVDAAGPVKQHAEPVAAGENGRYPENGAPVPAADNGAVGAAQAVGSTAAKPKVKVTRIVRKRKRVVRAEPVKVPDGPDTITGEHPVFGAQYKDGSTEFSRRVQRDFEAEIAADPELRRIRAEIVLNGEEGRNDWDGLESWEKKLYHSVEEKHFSRLRAKVRQYMRDQAKSRGVDYDAVMGDDKNKPRWMTDSIEDQIAAEGDPTVQMDLMRAELDKRLGRQGGTSFGPRGIPEEDIDALMEEERRRREEYQSGPAPQAVASSSGVLFPDESIPPEQFSSTLRWAETIKEKETEAEVSEVKKDVSELSEFSETRRWAEELKARDGLSEEEILQAHVDAHTTMVPKARLRRKRRQGDAVSVDDFERAKARAGGSETMREWSMEEFAREMGVDANAPDDFDEADYEAAGERVRERVRELVPQMKEIKKYAAEMGQNEFLKQHGDDLGLDVSVPDPRSRNNDGDPRWWVNLPEVQVILLNKSGKYQLLALDLTAEVTGSCYVIGFQDKKEAAWFRDWLSKVPHHASHSPVVQPIGPTELDEYAARTSSQVLVVRRGVARFKPNMTTDQMEFELMGLAEDGTVIEFMEKLLPEIQEMQKNQMDALMEGDPELVKMMKEVALGAAK